MASMIKQVGTMAASLGLSSMTGGMVPTPIANILLNRGLNRNAHRNDIVGGRGSSEGGFETKHGGVPPHSRNVGIEYLSDKKSGLAEWLKDPLLVKHKQKELKELSKTAAKYNITASELQIMTSSPKSLFMNAPDYNAAVMTGIFQVLQVTGRYQVAIAKSFGINKRNLLQSIDDPKKGFIGSMLSGINDAISSLPGVKTGKSVFKHAQNLLSILNPLTLSDKTGRAVKGVGEFFQKLLLGKKGYEYSKDQSRAVEDAGLKIADSVKLVNLTKVLTDVNIRQLDTLHDVRQILRGISSGFGFETNKYKKLDIHFDEFTGELMTQDTASKSRLGREQNLLHTVHSARGKGVLGTALNIAATGKFVTQKIKEAVTNKPGEILYNFIDSLYNRSMFDYTSDKVTKDIIAAMANDPEVSSRNLAEKDIMHLRKTIENMYSGYDIWPGINPSNMNAKQKSWLKDFRSQVDEIRKTSGWRTIKQTSSRMVANLANVFQDITGSNVSNSNEIIHKHRASLRTGEASGIAKIHIGGVGADIVEEGLKTNVFSKLTRALSFGIGGITQALKVGRSHNIYDQILRRDSPPEVPGYGKEFDSEHSENGKQSPEKKGFATVFTESVRNVISEMTRGKTLQQNIFLGTFAALHKLFFTTKTPRSTKAVSLRSIADHIAMVDSTAIEQPSDNTSEDSRVTTKELQEKIMDQQEKQELQKDKSKKKELHEAIFDIRDSLSKNNSLVAKPNKDEKKKKPSFAKTVLTKVTDGFSGIAGTLMKALGTAAIGALVNTIITTWKKGEGFDNFVQEFFLNSEGSITHAIGKSATYGYAGMKIGKLFGPLGTLVGFLGGATLGGIIGYFGTEKIGKFMGETSTVVSQLMDWKPNGIQSELSKWGDGIPFIGPLLFGLVGEVISQFGLTGSVMKGLLQINKQGAENKDFNEKEKKQREVDTKTGEKALETQDKTPEKYRKQLPMDKERGLTEQIRVEKSGMFSSYDYIEHSAKLTDAELKEYDTLPEYDKIDYLKNKQTYARTNKKYGSDAAYANGVVADKRHRGIVGEAGPEVIFRQKDREAGGPEYLKENKISTTSNLINHDENSGGPELVSGMKKTILNPGDTVVPLDRGRNKNFMNKYKVDPFSGGDEPSSTPVTPTPVTTTPVPNSSPGSSLLNKLADSNTYKNIAESAILAVMKGGSSLYNFGSNLLGGKSSGGNVDVSNMNLKSLGALSAKFESGAEGSASVGFDSTGGTSYGTYQLSSKQGSLKEFLEWCKTQGAKGKQIYDTMYAAIGGNWNNLNTGSATGAPVTAWKGLSKSGIINELEDAYYAEKFYSKNLNKLNPDVRKIVDSSFALQQSFWSTAVQHGGRAPEIWNKVFVPEMNKEQLADAVYTERSTRFGSSTPGIRSSVQQRFKQESAIVKSLISQESGKSGTFRSDKRFPKGYPQLSSSDLSRWKISPEEQLAWPAESSVINSPFGPRTPGTGMSKDHAGIDVKARMNDPIFSAMPGKIVHTNMNDYGRVQIDHGNGWMSQYLHLNSASVKDGDTVAAGQPIGTAGGRGPNGNTSAYKPHLHFEMLKDGELSDPEAVYNQYEKSGGSSKYTPGQYAADIKPTRHLSAKMSNSYAAPGERQDTDASGGGDDRGGRFIKDFNNFNNNKSTPASGDSELMGAIRTLSENIQKLQISTPKVVPIQTTSTTSGVSSSPNSSGSMPTNTGDPGIDDQINNMFTALGGVLKNFAIAHTNIAITTS